jgi:long-chain fatty acid transport protein
MLTFVFTRATAFTVAILTLFMAFATGPARAGNGNMLHGFGPVNSSMGGAGAGLWVGDPIGALMFNPALMAASEGSHVSFGTEFFEDGVEIDATVDATATSPRRTGSADPSNQLGILPSFGFTIRAPGSAWSFGFGLVGIAGFRTDYPQRDGSILFDNPSVGGFGRIYTDHRVTKIPLAVAYQFTEKLALGFSVNNYTAELAIAPLPYQVFDPQDRSVNNRYYRQGDGLDLEYAISFQPSFYYVATPDISIGGSVTTEQNFSTFRWNTTNADPNSPNFAQDGGKLAFDLDGPLIITLGAGIILTDKTSLALDASWIQYDGVAGFGSPGGIVDRIVFPFGWDNVWAFKAGLQHQCTENVIVRTGYNYSDIPIPDRNVLTATGAPAMFQHHFSAGLSLKLTETLTANLSGYFTPRATVTGPNLDLEGNRIGTIKTSNTLLSGLAGFSWNF